MPKWLLIKLMRAALIALRLTNRAVVIYEEEISPVALTGACALAAKVTYDEYYGIGMFAKSAEVEVDDNKRIGRKARRADNSKAWFGGNRTP